MLVACFCGELLEIEGDLARCPRCGEVATLPRCGDRDVHEMRESLRQVCGGSDREAP